MGLERDGEIVAGIIFSGFTGPDVDITVAGKGWTPGFVQSLGDYVYGQLGCERMTITTEHEAVARLGIKAGGQVEGRLRSHFGPGRDGIIVGILRSEWRYGSFPPTSRA